MLINSSSSPGKVWKPKEPEKVTVGRTEDEVAIETEWDEALQEATEEELVDLAGDDVIL